MPDALRKGRDRLVLIGEEADAEKGEDIRESRKEIYEELIDEVAPLDGAHELIADLKELGRTTVLASSSPEKEIDYYLDLLEARDLADGWTTDDDVEATKPEPDLVRAALTMARTDEAVLIGDTPWDIDSARKSGIETVTVITGGYSEQELRDAGAVGVYESVQELRAHLEGPPFV